MSCNELGGTPHTWVARSTTTALLTEEESTGGSEYEEQAPCGKTVPNLAPCPVRFASHHRSAAKKEVRSKAITACAMDHEHDPWADQDRDQPRNNCDSRSQEPLSEPAETRSYKRKTRGMSANHDESYDVAG